MIEIAAPYHSPTVDLDLVKGVRAELDPHLGEGCDIRFQTSDDLEGWTEQPGCAVPGKRATWTAPFKIDTRFGRFVIEPGRDVRALEGALGSVRFRTASGWGEPNPIRLGRP